MLAPLWHAVLDYGLAILFLIAPALFGFESAAARSLAHAIGATYIVASLVTRYPLGLLKLLPFPAHGVLETLAALGWLVLPYLAGFAGDRAARNFFVATAIALLAVVSITDYRAAQPGGERRRRKKDRRLRPSHVMADRRMTLLPRRAQ
jgi:hypothetical protein